MKNVFLGFISVKSPGSGDRNDTGKNSHFCHVGIYQFHWNLPVLTTYLHVAICGRGGMIPVKDASWLSCHLFLKGWRCGVGGWEGIYATEPE